jgi:homogentisate phytyltransferase/homogentisate geranylgeranyltransferase
MISSGWAFQSDSPAIYLSRGRHCPIPVRQPVAVWRNTINQKQRLNVNYRDSNSNNSIGNKRQSRLHKASTTTPIIAVHDDDRPKPSFLSILWRFTRPHTIIGSALAIPALHILASPSYSTAISIRSIVSMVYAMIPALLMNLYITGLNQITDVEIDKINKPDLPIAAGDLSLRDGIITVVISLILSIALGVVNPKLCTEGLNVALGVSALLGTLYSLPPIRLKRFPFLAAFCIVAVRGAVINAGFYAHAKVAAYGGVTSVWTCLTTDPRCWMSSLYFAIFGVVIALMKDVPDVKGDGLSNVRTFSVRLGPKRIYRWMQQLLTTLFWGVGVAFFRGATIGEATSIWSIRCGRVLVGIFSILAGMSVQREAAPIDPENSKEVYGFYMRLWKLFYLSYLVLPLAR